MWEHIHGFFSEQIKSNMLLQGGLALSVLGGAAVFLKQWGFALWRFILKKIVYTLDIPQETAKEIYDGLVYSFAEDVSKLSRFKIQKGVAEREYRIPIGKFLIWRGLSPIYFAFSEETVAAATTAQHKFNYSITIWGFLAKKKIKTILEKSMADHAERTKPEKEQTFVYKLAHKGGLNYITVTRPKPLEDIIMRDADMSVLVTVLDKWKASKARYHDLGLPYKLGLLFHGTPGTGKTSLAYSIALRLGYKIVRCSMRDITSECNFDNSYTVYVFDDIDREMEKDKKDEIKLEDGAPATERKGGTGVNTLLSLLDARLAASDIVIIMSCNDIHALDEAIFRPGRVDMVIEFCPPTKEMAERFMSKFYGKNISLPRFHAGRGMSFYQTCCLRHMDSPKDAVKEACDEMSNINYSPKGLPQKALPERRMAVEAA